MLGKFIAGDYIAIGDEMRLFPASNENTGYIQRIDGFNKYGYLLSSLVFVSQKRNYKYTKLQSYYHVINRMWVDTDRSFKTNLELQFNVKNGFRNINNSLCRPTI